MTRFRPEFENLEQLYRELRYGRDTGGFSKERYRRIRDLLRHCDYVVETAEEKETIIRTRHWYLVRLNESGLTLDDGLGDLQERQTTSLEGDGIYTAEDRRFLRALRIAADSQSKDMENEAK